MRDTRAVNFERRGQGTPLLLIHGVGSRWQIFEPLLDQLAEHHDVIAVDLPGFGDSPAEGKLGTVAGLVEQVVEFIAELGLDHPHVAGNSMGGGIALELAKRGVARSATAFSPIGFWSTAELIWTQQALYTLRATGRALGAALSKALPLSAVRTGGFGLIYGKPWRCSPEYLRADIEALVASTGFREAVESFPDFTPPTGPQVAGTPVTVAWGSRDALLIYRTQSARARRVLPNATHVTLTGAGHIPFPDDPQACVDVLLETTRRAE